MREKNCWEAGRLGGWEAKKRKRWAAGRPGGWAAKTGILFSWLFRFPTSDLRSLFFCFFSSALRFVRSSALRRRQVTVHRSLFTALPLFTALLLAPATAPAAEEPDVTSLLTGNDACMLATPDGREIVSVNGTTPLIPASTLKIFTALVGFHYLGADYRFPTEIYINDEGDLTIKGYGDPRLISEVIEQLALEIKEHLPAGMSAVRDIVLDDTYFTSPLTIPGVSDSSEPYDAPNGALCANFNTISFKKTGDGSYVSGEEQTPLLPAVLDRVRKSGLREGRIPLSHDRKETTGYTGHLLDWFLEKNGVTMTGRLRFSAVDKTRDRLLLVFQSPYSLSEVVSSLLEYSNNFMANQILIAAGARAYDAPGNLEKGVRAAQAFALEKLDLETLNITEGSGISRKNRITARTMLTVLNAFTPYRSLLRHEDYVYYKTGTLKGIATRAGYLMDDEGNSYPFVVMLNDSSGKMAKVMERLKELIDDS
jgi:D-alanyl-D-alanine carboxypeptidase/D-alanyl-D-alanine-endopeptidase (penicillin-binding protein 4)